MEERIPRRLDEEDEIALVGSQVERPKQTPEERKAAAAHKKLRQKGKKAMEDLEATLERREREEIEDKEAWDQNVLWIQQQQDLETDHEDIIKTLREAGWSEEDVTNLLVAAHLSREEAEQDIPPSKIPDSGQSWIRPGVIETPMMHASQTVQHPHQQQQGNAGSMPAAPSIDIEPPHTPSADTSTIADVPDTGTTEGLGADVDAKGAVNPFKLRKGMQEEMDTLHYSEPEEAPIPDEAAQSEPEEENPSKRTPETGTHKKLGEFEDIDYTDMPSKAEGTPKEKHDKLSSLIEAYRKTLEGAKEKVNWWKSSEEGLIRRSAELDAEAEKMSVVGKTFLKMGEWYNKRDWKTKLAVGAGLGLGAVFTAGSLAIAIPLLGIGIQRTLGLSTMYLKFEKNSHDEAWGKEKALLKAGAYTVILGLAMKEAIEYASETEFAHTMQAKVSNWLGDVFGHHQTAPGTVPAQEIQATDAMGNPTGQTIRVPEGSPAMSEQLAAAAAAGEAAKSAVAPEVPGIEVKASPGHGYEYMTKRLWEQLQEKHVKLPAGANPDSDLAKLLAADKNSIDKVVHQLAQDNEFFKENGTSAHINLDAKMTIDTKGNILLGEDILAPEGGSVTPVYHPEVPAADISVTTEPVVPLPAETPFFHPDAPIAVADAPAAAVEVINHDFVINKFEVTVPLAEPNLYEAADGRILAYGGSLKEQKEAILKYLTAHPGTSITTADPSGKYRVGWMIFKDKLIQSEPMRAKGLLGIFGSFMAPPGPDELMKVVK